MIFASDLDSYLVEILSCNYNVTIDVENVALPSLHARREDENKILELAFYCDTIQEL